jgi:uridine kinase
MDRPVVIGLAGGTGSGKTTLAEIIKAAFDNDAVLLSHDFYYKPNEHLTFEQRSKLNYDHPNAFDTGMMIEDLKRLRAGQAIEHPIYSFSIHTRLPERQRMNPAKVIIAEGILIFENEALRELMDMKVYVDTDADVRILRRILRDVKERGRDLNSVVTQYLETVKPMHDQFVEPSKRYADIIVPQGGLNTVAAEMLISRIKELISEHE